MEMIATRAPGLGPPWNGASELNPGVFDVHNRNRVLAVDLIESLFGKEHAG